jgi:hypothetical protein
MSRHVIETLSWVCRSADRQIGYAQQQRVSSFLQGPGARALEALFDRLSPQDEIWRIDRLEIELDGMDTGADAGLWASRLETAVETALLRLRHEDVSNVSSRRSNKPRRVDDVELDNFLYYLEHGRLHWSMSALTSGDTADWLARLAQRCGTRLWSALQRLPHAERSLQRLSHITPCHGLQALLAARHAGLARALDALDVALLEPLRAHDRLSAYQIAQVRQAWRVAGLYALWGEGGSALGVARVQRLLATMGESLLGQLGESRAGERPAWLGHLSRTLGASDLQRSLLLGMQMRLLGASPENNFASGPARAHSESGTVSADADQLILDVAWHESLRQFALAHHGEPAVRAAGLGLSELQTYLRDYSLAYLSTVDRVPQDHVAWQHVWRRALQALAVEEGAATRSADELASSRVSAEAVERPKIRNRRNDDGSISPADDYPGQEAIYIANAGLVLLANYAPRLFAMLGLVKDDAFVSDAARNRAVHCLAYLTDGHARSEEHAWVLNKMLCGMPIDEPVPPAAPLDDVRATLDGLIAAVIAHWGALGRTSHDGLRRTFLQRIGRLVEHEAHVGEHWRMKVQPGPFDVLLDRLPWGYGTIKLPWMKGALHVDWR